MSEPATRCLREIDLGLKAYSVDWSPDGSRLAIGGEDGRVDVRTAEGRPVWQRTIDGSSGVLDCRWSPDGRYVAAAAQRVGLSVWDAHRGTEQLAYPSDAGLLAVSWHPRHGRVALGDGRARILDIATGEEIETWAVAGERVWALCYSPDGTFLAAGTHSGRLWVRDERRGVELGPFEGHKGEVRRLAWSNDRQRLASASWDGSVLIWEPPSRQSVQRLEGHGGTAYSVSWSPDGALIAFGTDADSVRIHSLTEGREELALRLGSRICWSLAFSPDGTRLATASDEHVRIWDVADLIPRRRRPRSAGSYVARQAATVGRAPGGASRWVPQLPQGQGALLGVLEGTGAKARGGHSTCLAFTGQDERLLTGHPDGLFRYWDLRAGVEFWQLEVGLSRVQDIALSPDGKRAVAACQGGLAVLSISERAGIVENRIPTSDWAHQASWSPRGDQLLAVSTAEPRLQTWDASSAEPLQQWASASTWTASWSPDGSLLALGSSEGALEIWDPAKKAHHRNLGKHGQWVRMVRWSPGGHHLASAHRDRQILIWDCSTWQIVRSFDAPGPQAVSWSPRGRRLASGGDGGDVILWDVAAGRQLGVLESDASYVWRVAWSPNGAFLAASYQGDIFRFWDVRHLTASATAVSRPRASVSVPLDLSPLPAAFGSLARLDRFAPLSLIRDLLAVTAGASVDDERFEPLGRHAALAGLVGLRWPTAARVGLVSLLLRDRLFEDWRPPAGPSPTELAREIAGALEGEEIEPRAPPPPVAALLQAADTIDDRLLTLLEVVGPEAVAADPSLPLRLLPQAERLPPMATGQRRLLGLRLQLDGGGPAQGRGASGERAGIDVRGDLRSLLASQLALPGDVFASRLLRRELLYRAVSGRETPRLRPTVLLLDVSPAVFGPVEATTRLAAHVVASTLLEARLPAMLVTCGGDGTVRSLERTSDLVELWTARSLEPPREARALRTAGGLRETLAGGPLEPIILLLTHPFFGAEQDLPEVSGLRALFVGPSGGEKLGRPAVVCDLWDWMPTGVPRLLPACLAKLLA